MHTISSHSTPLNLDGSLGEGGGQVLRTALALSICTGKPFHITRIRAGRKKPGLQRQHLTAVQAASQISRAHVEGDAIGSTTLFFHPGEVQPGNYHFSVGTAGSTTLVLQTLLYPLLLATGPSHLVLEGGTHNPLAPPFDFFSKTFLPLLNRLGPQVNASLTRYGFYPRGGGQWTIDISPTSRLGQLSLLERGKLITRQATALVAGIPAHVAERELQRVADKMGWSETYLQFCILPADQGPGNVLLLELRYENITEIFTSFGERGVSAETVADKAITEVRNYLASGVPVGEHLADQLLLPLALAGRGEFVTVKPSSHTLTNMEIIKQFLDVSITTTALGEKGWMIKVESG